MAAVVNHLRFKDPVDPAIFAAAQRDLVPAMRAVAGFQRLEVVQTSDHEVILIILGDTIDVLDRVATEIGSPWMVANVVPLLDGPPQRHVGTSLATSET